MKISEIITLPVGLAIRWDDGAESLLPYQALREGCPCAHCSGESDLFGNKTFGIPVLKSQKAYQLQSFRWVGHYAIQFVWEDRHDAGIYTLKLLREMGEITEDEG